MHIFSVVQLPFQIGYITAVYSAGFPSKVVYNQFRTVVRPNFVMFRLHFDSKVHIVKIELFEINFTRVA